MTESQLPLEERIQLDRDFRIYSLQWDLKHEPRDVATPLFEIELELLEEMDDSLYEELFLKGTLDKYLQDETVRIWKIRTGKIKESEEPQTTCLTCGQPFTPTHRTQKFCSAKCSQEAQRTKR